MKGQQKKTQSLSQDTRNRDIASHSCTGWSVKKNSNS